MKVTLTSDDGGVFPMDIGTDLTVQDLRALAELETRIPQEEVLLVHNMAPLVDLTKTVSECGVEEGDIIVASRVEGGVAQTMPGSSQPPAVLNNPGHPPNQGSRPVQRQQAQQDPENPETIRQHFLNNPYELSLLRQRNPPLAEALLSGDRERFRDALERQRRAVRDAERERIRILNADPLDPDYQAKIARDIQEKNIAENMEAAIEYTPESFSHVVMLYLDIRVNGVLVRALVDSGARTTVMSQACAERCNIMRLVDRRYTGMAFGVGQQRILGRVHLGQLQIGRDFLTSSFTVLETAPEDMLLGLDMLKRHQCCIDLKDNCLRIGTTGNSAPFLTEKDLKGREELEKKQMEAFNEKEDFEMAQAISNSQQSEMKAGERAVDSRPSTSSHPVPHSSPTSQPPPPNQAQTFPEGAIQQITALGFSRDDAIRELRQTNGNAQLALAALLARSIKL